MYISKKALKTMSKHEGENFVYVNDESRDLEGYAGDQGHFIYASGEEFRGKPTGRYGYIHLSNTTLHRVIAYAFGLIPDISYDGTHDVDHINNDKADCRLSNLRVLTHYDNIQYRDLYGNSGDKAVDMIDPKTNKVVGTFRSIHMAARVIGAESCNISSAIKQPWRHVRGYSFRFHKEDR
jgi:hypothetical protein